ncbi:MAG: hypothetical protein R3344_14745, partial [Acidobacteriota bacterium]|nr:hypothetical protein [Acidobacteriota bacterium]
MTRNGAILIVAVLVLGIQAWMLDYVVDDAFISFRYADNLVEGHGLTFNPGGPRVEGYTNFGWTLLMTVPIALGADPRTASLVFGILAGMATLFLAERLAARAGAGLWSPVAPALLAVNPAMVAWSAGGLETATFAALVTGGALMATSGSAPRWIAGIVLSLACLMRPEGALLALLIFAGVIWSEGRAGIVRLLPTGALVLATVALHTLFRLVYYGTLLPNTFHAKTGDLGAQVDAGLPYVFGGLAYFGGGPLLLVVVALAWRRRSTA